MTESERRLIVAELDEDIRNHLDQWKESKNWNAVGCQLENIYLQGQLYMAMKAEVISFDLYLELCEALDIRNWIEELQNKEVADNE